MSPARGLDQSAPAGGGWEFETFSPAPEGRSWNLLHASAQGAINGDHERVTRDLVVDGVTCYRHRVREGGIVEMVNSVGPIIEVDFARIDRALLRFHHFRDAYSGDDGKDIAFNLGYGYQGDMVNGKDRFNPLVSPAEAFGSTEGAVANSMHPGRDSNTTNAVRMLVTHAHEIPRFDKRSEADNSRFQGEYFGDNVGSPGIAPLGRWNCVDIIAHRTEGWSQYQNGVLIGRSAEQLGEPERRVFDDWDAQRAIWYWHRHMHGGKPEKLPARRDYDEYFGGFFLAVA